MFKGDHYSVCSFLPLLLVAMEGKIVGLAFADICNAPRLLIFEIFR